MRPPTHYILACDVETSGSCFRENAILAIGCSLQNMQGEEVKKFFRTLKIPKERGFEEDCLKNFWSKHTMLLKFFEKEADETAEVMHEFVEFMEKVDQFDSVIIICDNPSFDIAWIDYYLSYYTARKPMRYCSRTNAYRMVWDTTSLHKIWFCLKNKMVDFYNPPKGHVANLGLKCIHAHHPLEDARELITRHRHVIHQMEKSYVI